VDTGARIAADRRVDLLVALGGRRRFDFRREVRASRRREQAVNNALSGEKAARTPATVAEIRREFKHADRNVDGRIDFDEFCELLQGLDAGMNAPELRQGFHEVDANKDGLIDQQEFIDWWTTD